MIGIFEGPPIIRELFSPAFNPFVNVFVLDMMISMRFIPGLGLGRSHQGISKALKIDNNRCQFGLGYHPTKKDWLLKNELLERKS